MNFIIDFHVKTLVTIYSFNVQLNIFSMKDNSFTYFIMRYNTFCFYTLNTTTS